VADFQKGVQLRGVPLAHELLAVSLRAEGRLDEAIRGSKECLRISRTGIGAN